MVPQRWEKEQRETTKTLGRRHCWSRMDENCEGQFGFTKSRSTTEAGVELTEQIFGVWEESRDAICVFCDLSKTFDCVHHNALIRKLHHYDVRGLSLGLLESYLSGRVLKVDINGTHQAVPVLPVAECGRRARRRAYIRPADGRRRRRGTAPPPKL
ncbi:hypothetical protein EVAR_10212_1 [Eumeta japonica]|uniref:Uncharacterized protein n=1 Tax=Eumeta variegata TaxID=151549 RepID=A0A4C1TGW9_EUMVA|nr:hypothetical protein EVAR_10212_1 [Eumeta japonica]